MYCALVLLAMLASAVNGSVLQPPASGVDSRIFGGEDADIADFLYQVSVRLFGLHFCGGSIVNEKVILTAAHCIYNINPGFYAIQYGSSDLYDKQRRVIVPASAMRRHHKYSRETNDYDIALIFLAAPIEFGELVQSIGVASVEPATGTKAIVSGWGVTDENGFSSHRLQQAAVEIVDREVCTEQYSKVNNITERMLCAGDAAGGKDACLGDSGGPLVVDGELVGIVSWGVGCGRRDYAGVYTSVANLQSWLKSNLPQDN